MEAFTSMKFDVVVPMMHPKMREKMRRRILKGMEDPDSTDELTVLLATLGVESLEGAKKMDSAEFCLKLLEEERTSMEDMSFQEIETKVHSSKLSELEGKDVQVDIDLESKLGDLEMRVISSLVLRKEKGVFYLLDLKRKAVD